MGGVLLAEVWRDVPGYESLYEVSSKGAVKSKTHLCAQRDGHERIRYGRTLEQQVNRYGYLYVTLADGKGHKKNVSVHRIVMAAFRGESSLTVNHKDEDKRNNALSNLEYMTAHDNLMYGTGRKRLAEAAKARRIPVESFDLATGETVQAFAGVNETAKQGFSPQCVSHCINGKIKSHKGFGWRRKDGDGH